MARRLHVFGDESGNLDFRRAPGATRYFVITTVTFFDDFQACRDLDALRRDLAWRAIEHPGPFHATEDPQHVRDEVFRALGPHRFRVDATVIEKSKTEPRVRLSDERFYQYAWYYHLKYLAPQITQPGDELLIVAASIGTKKSRAAFYKGVKDVVRQVLPSVGTRTASWSAASDTGLQVADYCGWAIYRKWESGDSRPHESVATKIGSEFDLFARGQRHYY